MYKVLIVDDCTYDVNGLVTYVPWADLKCEVVGTAANGVDGLEAALKHEPDIVITDISMPQRTGIEMAEKISERLPNMIFIYMSCFSSFEYAKKAVNNNALAYLLKPINIEELNDALKNAVKVLDERFEQTERYEYLNEQFLNNKDILRENYLLSILQGTEKNKANRKLFEFCEDSKYHICILKAVSTDTARLDVMYARQVYLRELLEYHLTKVYCTKFELDEIAAIIDEKELNEDSMVFQEMQELLPEKFSDSSLLVYITCDSFALDELPKQFQSLINIIHDNYFEMRDQIVYIDADMLNSQVANNPLSVSMIYDDVYSVLTFDMQIEEFEQKYIFDGAVVDTVYLKSLCYLVICVINIFLIERNKSFNDIFEDDVLVWEKLAKFQTIMNIKQWLFNILSLVRNFMSEQINIDKTTAIVNEIKSYIDKNYADFDVVEQAVHFQKISLNYARKIFKNKEGQTIFDYLIKKRMNEAVRLLTATNLPVNEIAERVGYFSNSYFSTAFKKYTGMNPSKYRENSARDK